MLRLPDLPAVSLSRALVFAALTLVPGWSLAQTGPAPLRVAIVGLVHDPVAGFLAQLPQHHDVELVGIAEADQVLVAKYEKKYNLPH